MEPVPVPSPEPTEKDSRAISDDEITKARSVFDDLSWTLFDEYSRGQRDNVLKINYTNIFLIESYDWFGTDGLGSFFENKEMVLNKVGTVRVIDHRLDKPMKDDLGSSSSPLYPNEARLSKLDYVGNLFIKIEIIWDKQRRGMSDQTYVSQFFQIGKIPIMVGSSFCNLSSIQTKKELESKGECDIDFMGYFIMNGNEKNLIAQNYRNVDDPITIASKMGSQNQPLRTACDIKSKGRDYNIRMHKIFILKETSNRIEHGDRRIYIKMPFIAKGPPFHESKTIFGANLVTIFRLSLIYIHKLNPFIPDGSYSYSSSGDGRYKAGFQGESTFRTARDVFEFHMYDYAGPKLWKLIQNYYNDTINEASLEEDEEKFWENTVHLMKNSTQDASRAVLAEDLLKDFGNQFLPHLSKIPFQAQIRDLNRLNFAFRESLREMHRIKGISDDNAEIDVSIAYLMNSQTNMESLMAQRGVYAKELEFSALKQQYATIVSDFNDKFRLLAYMAIKVLSVELGIDVYDDKDSLVNQMYEHAGILMMTRFSSMFRDIESKMRDEDLKDGDAVVSQMAKNGKAIISQGFSTNFNTGDWNSRKADTSRHGVTDIMPSNVNVARLSYLRRVSAKAGTNSKHTESRELTGLQPGAICISETPEGTQCGNVEHLATAAFLTNDSYDSHTLAYKLAKIRSGRRDEEIPSILDSTNIMREMGDISPKRAAKKETPLFLNGRPIGWVDGLQFRRKLIEMRRLGSIHPHTGIHYVQKYTKIGMITHLKITTGAGRIVQPMIITENTEMTLNMIRELTSPNIDSRLRTVDSLMKAGYIEFIDSAEMEFLDIAPSIDIYLKSVQNGLAERFDHVLLNPGFLMGAAANIMPFASHNPVVRNSYFTQMVKQPIVTAMPTMFERAYTATNKLEDVQVPLVSTAGYDTLFPDDHFGRNLNILITPNKYGEEDGIVVNKKFIDMGGLASAKYSTFPIELKQNQELNFGENFMESQLENDPDRYGRGIIKVRKRVLKKDSSGNEFFAEEPVIVRPNEILARKMWSGDDRKSLYEDVRFDSMREGIVDRIMWSKGAENSKMVYIVIRMPDTIWIGDKLASRYSQKGLTAMVVPDQDMPFDPDTGERADLIINPQAFPSRMTVGMLNEMLVGSAHVMPDKKKTVHILYNNQDLDIYAPLERLFIVDKAKWKSFIEAGGIYTKSTRPDLSAMLGLAEDFDQVGQLMPIEQGSTGETSTNVIQDGIKYTMIPSESISDQNSVSFLKDNDVGTSMPGYEFGIWAIKYYDISRTGSEVKFVVIGPSDDIDKLKNDIHGLDAVARYIQVAPGDIEIIDDSIDQPLLFDLEKDENDQYINFMTGIRVSRLPVDVRTLYLRGNTSTPVADKYIAGYRERFFTRTNLRFMDFDYIIPENMLDLGQVFLKEDPQTPQSIILPIGTRYSELEKEKSIVLVTSDSPGKSGQTVETTLLAIWNSKYSSSSMIPQENVIMLPERPRDIYLRRRDRIMELREASIFKGGIDIKDAMRELELMGYSEDASKKFYNGKTGQPMAGNVVSGWSYYMALKHKVKDKAQARGEGIMDPRHGQPNQGKSKEGGLKFNYADALASIQSGATAFVHDRLLNATGKTNVYVCTTCREICYKENKGSIVCPMCKSNTSAVKISIPYIFMYIRNLLMGAGVRLGLSAIPDDEE